jgi:hypothetical protein
MLIQKHPPSDRRQNRHPGQQQGGPDLPTRQQYGELVPPDDPMPPPTKPDIEDPEDAQREGDYDRFV